MKPIIENGIAGYKECPAFLLDAYRRATKICQHCNHHKYDVGPLGPHRIKRGRDGGLYTVCKLNQKGSNVKMLCNDCHKLMHQNEYPHVSHSY